MKSFAKVSMRILAVLMVLVVLSSFAISCGLPIAADGGKKAIETVNELEFERYQAKERTEKTKRRSLQAHT